MEPPATGLSTTPLHFNVQGSTPAPEHSVYLYLWFTFIQHTTRTLAIHPHNAYKDKNTTANTAFQLSHCASMPRVPLQQLNMACTCTCSLLSFFFFCVLQLYLWGSPFWVRFLHMWLLFIPTIEVVIFCLHWWCMLGVFLLPEFTCLEHEYQDLLSPCDRMHVCID